MFQVEYAAKAVENSGTVIALRGKDGVVFAVEKLVTSKLYEPGANKRIFHIDEHVGMVSKLIIRFLVKFIVLDDTRNIFFFKSHPTRQATYPYVYRASLCKHCLYIKWICDFIRMYYSSYSTHITIKNTTLPIH